MSSQRDIYEVYVAELVRHYPVIIEPVKRRRSERLGFHSNRGNGASAKARRKFTDDQVREIIASPESTKGLARRLGVSHPVIRSIRARKTYRDVHTPLRP